MERIQALEKKEFPKEDLDKIEYCLKRDCIDFIRELDCPTMRDYLKETKLTKYNDHTALLVKTFSKKSPPQLTF